MAAAGLLLVALAWLYGGTVHGLVVEWTSSPESSYGAILAAIAVAVAWRRRGALRALSDPDSSFLPGVAVLLLGLGVYLAGLLGSQLYLTRLSLVIVLTGIVRLLCGPRTLRVAAAPLAFLLLAVPLPALVVNAVTLPLQLVASRLAEFAIRAGGMPVYRDGNLLALPSTTLEVAEACSGLRSLVSLGAIGLVLAWATERTLLRRTAVVAASVPIAIVMNALRVAATGFACELWDRRAASGGWHTFSGWITFVIAVGLLVRWQALLERLRLSRVPAAREAAAA